MLTFIHYNTLNSALWIGQPRCCWVSRKLSKCRKLSNTLMDGWKMIPLWCHKGHCHCSVTPCSTSFSQFSEERKADDSCCSFQEAKYRTCETLTFISSSSVSFKKKKKEIVFLFSVMSHIYALQSSNMWENLHLSLFFFLPLIFFFNRL